MSENITEAPVEEVTDFETVPLEDVDVPVVDDEAEEIATTEDPSGGDASIGKGPKEPAKPKRGDLPEGLVTPVQFAKELSKPIDGNADNLDESNWRYTHSKTGDHTVQPQMVYSYLKSGKGDNALATQTVEDSNGVKRDNVLVLADALAWWDGKADRAAARAAAAREKAEKKAAKDASKPEAAADESAVEVVEAE